MRITISPSKLDQFKCSECGQFLSLGPIRIKLDGTSVCGRCNGENDPDLVPLTRNYAYEAAAIVYLFPCTYHASGCPTQVPFNDTTQHELFCSYRTHNCPNQSGCSWSGTVKELTEHYLSNHNELCLETALIELKLRSDFIQSYLLHYKYFHFLLQIKSSINDRKLWLNLIYLGNPNEANFMQYSFQLGSNQTKSCIMLEERVAFPYAGNQMDLNNALDVDSNGVLTVLKHPDIVNCSWTININKEFEEQKTQLDMLQCPSCKNYMALPIYQCERDHVCCADCKGFEMDCIGCKKDGIVTPLGRAEVLEKLANDLNLPCRWKGCQYKTKEIRQHEEECVMRRYRCPYQHCIEWIGSLTCLIEHLKTIHPQNKVHTTSGVTCATFLNNSYHYIITHGELFSCRFEQTMSEGLLLQIYYKGQPSVASNFQYELEVIDSNGVSKLHKLSRFIKNRYEVRVPLLYKDSSKQYKIKIIKSSKSYINMYLE